MDPQAAAQAIVQDSNPNPTSPVEGVNPAPTAPEVKEPPKEDKFASKFAALSRKEKILYEKEKQIKELENKYKGYDTERSSLEESIKANPLEFLKKYGISYDDITKRILNDDKPTEEQRLREVETKLEKKMRELEEKEVTSQRAQYENTIKAFKVELDGFLNENKDTYAALMIEDNPSDIVYDIIEETFKTTKKVISNKEAADMAEKYFDEKAQKIASIKKYSAVKLPEEPKKAIEKAMSATLTNGMETKPPVHQGELDPRDPYFYEKSIERAAKLIKFT